MGKKSKNSLDRALEKLAQIKSTGTRRRRDDEMLSVVPFTDKDFIDAFVDRIMEHRRAWYADANETDRRRHRLDALRAWTDLSDMLISWAASDGVPPGEAVKAADPDRNALARSLADAAKTSSLYAYAILSKRSAADLGYALSALDSGEVARILIPENRSKWDYRSARILKDYRQNAVQHYYFRVGKGEKTDSSALIVGSAFNATAGNIKNWASGRSCERLSRRTILACKLSGALSGGMDLISALKKFGVSDLPSDDSTTKKMQKYFLEMARRFQDDFLEVDGKHYQEALARQQQIAEMRKVR